MNAMPSRRLPGPFLTPDEQASLRADSTARRTAAIKGDRCPKCAGSEVEREPKKFACRDCKHEWGFERGQFWGL